MAVQVKIDLPPGVSEFFRVPGLNKGERHSITVESVVSKLHPVLRLFMGQLHRCHRIWTSHHQPARNVINFHGLYFKIHPDYSHAYEQLLCREHDTFFSESPTYRTRQPTSAQSNWAEPYPAKQLLYHRIAVCRATCYY